MKHGVALYVYAIPIFPDSGNL